MHWAMIIDGTKATTVLQDRWGLAHNNPGAAHPQSTWWRQVLSGCSNTSAQRGMQHDDDDDEGLVTGHVTTHINIRVWKQVDDEG